MQAVIVTGPEGCGNRLHAAALHAAGCYGTGSTDEPYNEHLPTGESPVVIIRSYPHGDEWPDLQATVERLQATGYGVMIVVTVRDVTAYNASWCKDRPDRKADAYQVYCDAYRAIFKAIEGTRVPFVLSDYEAVMMRPGPYLSRLVGLCGLSYTFEADPELLVDGNPRRIADANGKYYR